MNTKIIKRLTVAYPAGNTTAIVWDDLPGADRKRLNQNIISSWQKQFPEMSGIEQCCFIKQPKDPSALIRVEMFGGEFCGNAARGVIKTLAGDNDCRGRIEVSGIRRPLNFAMDRGIVELEMPVPRGEFIKQVKEGILVEFDGITQLVVDPVQYCSPVGLRLLMEQIIRNNLYNLTAKPALGISLFDKAKRIADFCVRVKEVDTVFDETACGSGTAAIGLAEAYIQKNTVSFEVTQPSGEQISTTARFNSNEDTITSSISGETSTLYDGEFKLYEILNY